MSMKMNVPDKQPNFQTILNAFRTVGAQIIELPEADRPAWRNRLDAAMAHVDSNAKLAALNDMNGELAEREMVGLLEELGLRRND